MHYLSKLIRNAFNPFEVLLHELISRGGPLPPGAGPMELASLAAGGMPMDPSMMGMGMMGEWDHYTRAEDHSLVLQGPRCLTSAAPTGPCTALCRGRGAGCLTPALGCCRPLTRAWPPWAWGACMMQGHPTGASNKRSHNYQPETIFNKNCRKQRRKRGRICTTRRGPGRL